MLLLKGGVTSQGMQAAYKGWKRQRTDPPLDSPEGTHSPALILALFPDYRCQNCKIIDLCCLKTVAIGNNTPHFTREDYGALIA